MNIINPYRFGVATTPIPLENIISEYKFENNVLDTVGTNDGTATALTYASGLVGQTGVFNGSTSKVYVSDSNDLSFGNGTTDVPFSISFLFQFKDTIKGMLVAKSNKSSPREYYIYYDGAKIRFRLFSGGSSVIYKSMDYNFIPTVNQVYHLTSTYDGTTLKLYIDAIQLGSLFTGGTYVAMSNTTENVTMGYYSYPTPDLYANVNLDCVRIWNKELTQEEVTEIATDELNGIDINP